MPMNTPYLSEGTTNFTTAVAFGVGGQALTFAGGSKQSIVAITAVATKSTETTFTDNNARVGDLVLWGLGTSTSSLSGGITVDVFVSAASTITVRYSAVTAANQAQPAISLSYGLLRF